MDELSAILVTKALDGLAMRASAVSQNIANANSPSYLPFRVSFEEQLREAAAQGTEAARRFKPEFTRLPTDRSNREVRLDLEMASASHTALRYAALIEDFGETLASDARFQKVVADVHRIIATDRETRQLLRQAVEQLKQPGTR